MDSDTTSTSPPDSSPASAETQSVENDNPFLYDSEPPAESPEGESPPDTTPNPNPNPENVPDPEGEAPPPEPESYTLDLGEYWGGTDELRGHIHTRAQEAGITPEQGSRFVSSVIADMHAEESARLQAGAKQLRADWGESYTANVKATQDFILRAAKGAGLSPEQVAALNSREGFLLMNSIRQGLGESRAASNASPSQTSSRDQARDMLHNPNNPHYEGLTNREAPIEQRRAAIRQYNSLMGRTVFIEP